MNSAQHRDEPSAPFSRRMIPAIMPGLLLLFIAGVSAMCMWAGCLLVEIVPAGPPALVYGLLLFYLYMVNRYTDRNEDRANCPDRSALFEATRLPLWMAVFSVLGVVTILLVHHTLNAYYLMNIALGTAYSVRLIPGIRSSKFALWRIKDFGWFKPFFLAMMWGQAFFLFPLSYGFPASSKFTLWVVLSFSFTALNFSNVLFCDILDKEGDRAAGIKTLPVTVGVRLSLQIITLVCLLCAVLILWFQMALNAAGFPVLLFLYTMALYPCVYVLVYVWTRSQTGGLTRIIAESDILVFALGLLILVHLPGAR